MACPDAQSPRRTGRLDRNRIPRGTNTPRPMRGPPSVGAAVGVYTQRRSARPWLPDLKVNALAHPNVFFPYAGVLVERRLERAVSLPTDTVLAYPNGVPTGAAHRLDR